MKRMKRIELGLKAILGSVADVGLEYRRVMVATI